MASHSGFLCSRCFRALSRDSKSLRANSTAARYLHVRRPIGAAQHRDGNQSTTKRSIIQPVRRWQTTITSTQNSTPHMPPPTINQPTSQNPPTVAILNPRSDPDSDTNAPMAISITPRAAARLSQIMAKDSNPSLCLRVRVEFGGCHGYQYLMSLADAADVSEEDDTVFAVLADGANGGSSSLGEGSWREITSGRPKVVMDEPCLEVLKGSKVDYTMELIGSQFKIVDNPRATSSCGCGTSFDVK